MPLNHPIFYRTIKVLSLDSLEAGYEHPILENLDALRDAPLQESEERIFPIIDRCRYQNPSVRRNEEELDIPLAQDS